MVLKIQLVMQDRYSREIREGKKCEGESYFMLGRGGKPQKKVWFELLVNCNSSLPASFINSSSWGECFVEHRVKKKSILVWIKNTCTEIGREGSWKWQNMFLRLVGTNFLYFLLKVFGLSSYSPWKKTSFISHLYKVLFSLISSKE